LKKLSVSSSSVAEREALRVMVLLRWGVCAVVAGSVPAARSAVHVSAYCARARGACRQNGLAQEMVLHVAKSVNTPRKGIFEGQLPLQKSKFLRGLQSALKTELHSAPFRRPVGNPDISAFVNDSVACGVFRFSNKNIKKIFLLYAKLLTYGSL
jgi:hypothetical protein